MRAHTRRPTYGLSGQQIGWELVVMDVPPRGLYPEHPDDCPWFRADGQHHACCTGEGEAFCPDLVALTDRGVICTYGLL